jgi:Glyoxalase-like domain
VQQALGVIPQAGGEHSRMGTHNLLLRLGEASYLEVIAPNPAAPHPGRPRWFEIDEYDAGAAARLATWAVRTDDIRKTVAEMPEEMGPVEVMSRGDLEWLITVPSNGKLLLDGVGPALIQWPIGRHPASNLIDVGCRLLGLEVFHAEPARVFKLLKCLGMGDVVSVQPLPNGTQGYLTAHIGTPTGLRTVSTPKRSRAEGRLTPQTASADERTGKRC